MFKWLFTSGPSGSFSERRLKALQVFEKAKNELENVLTDIEVAKEDTLALVERYKTDLLNHDKEHEATTKVLGKLENLFK